MNKIFVIFFLLFGFTNSQAQWVSLIKEDLKNWEIKQGNAQFKISDGVISATSILNSPSTYLATKEFYSDFILEFEVFVDKGLNSGVQFRSLINDDANERNKVYGYQCELDTDEYRRWSGGIYDQSRRGLFLYPLSFSEKSRMSFKNNEWNKFRIEAIGNIIKTWVNGIQCSYLIDNSSNTGFIALQIHSINKVENVGKKVSWKNIKILTKDLEKNVRRNQSHVRVINNLDNFLSDDEINEGWKFLFDGKSSSGWKSARGKSFPKHGWKINDGIIKVLRSDGGESKNGGDIITIDKYSDFELELDFKISKGANSGIKYYVDTERYQVSGSSIGLEFQILDDFNHSDANKEIYVYEYDGKNKVMVKNYIKTNRTVASLYDLIKAENLMENRSKRPVYPETWHRARIISIDGKVEHWLDNIKVLEYNRFSQVFKSLVEYSKYSKYKQFGQLNEGHILLQDHGDEVSFKNIKIRNLK